MNLLNIDSNHIMRGICASLSGWQSTVWLKQRSFYKSRGKLTDSKRINLSWWKLRLRLWARDGKWPRKGWGQVRTCTIYSQGRPQRTTIIWSALAIIIFQLVTSLTQLHLSQLVGESTFLEELWELHIWTIEILLIKVIRLSKSVRSLSTSNRTITLLPLIWWDGLHRWLLSNSTILKPRITKHSLILTNASLVR